MRVSIRKRGIHHENVLESRDTHAFWRGAGDRPCNAAHAAGSGQRHTRDAFGHTRSAVCIYGMGHWVGLDRRPDMDPLFLHPHGARPAMWHDPWIGWHIFWGGWRALPNGLQHIPKRTQRRPDGLREASGRTNKASKRFFSNCKIVSF